MKAIKLLVKLFMEAHGNIHKIFVRINNSDRLI